MDSNGITDQDLAKVRMLYKAYTEHYTFAYLFYTHMLFMYFKKKCKDISAPIVA